MQPYHQLAQYFRATGHEKLARQVLLNKEKLRRAQFQSATLLNPKSWLRALWNKTLLISVGYGYRLTGALWAIPTVILIGAFVFRLAFQNDLMLLTDRSGGVTSSYFSSVAYSVDLFFPFLDLGQEHFWAPDQGVCWLSIWYYLQITLGWLLSSLVAASIVGVLRKE